MNDNFDSFSTLTTFLFFVFRHFQLPDYDLCENCYGNYKGKEIVFEPAELDRDRDAQDRWHARWENSRGMRQGRFGRGNGPRGQRFGRLGMKPCRPGRFSGPTGPPPPHHMAGPPPPMGCPPPPSLHCPPPPPPPHHPPHFPPHMGPGGFHHPFHFAHLGPHVSPHIHCPANGSASEFDNALKEAIRRSLKDIAPKEAKINEQEEAKPKPSAPVEEAAPAAKNEESTKVTCMVESPTISEEVASGIPRSVDVVMDGTNDEESVGEEDAEQAAAMEKSMDETESVNSEKLTAEEDILVASPSPSKTSTASRKISDSSKDESFASDAKGSGDVAEAMGAALDAVVNVIREMQAESAESYTEAEDEVADGSGSGEIILDSTELLQKADDKDDDSEWSVVKSVGSNGTTESEQIAKAAEMLGSALFNSDMKTSSENSGGENRSALSGSSFSVPSSVPTDIGTHQTNVAAPAQLDRWAAHLLQLQELGFDNEPECIEVLERLEAANIGVDAEDDVSINHVVNELLEKK
jgi:hypothetical protein